MSEETWAEFGSVRRQIAALDTRVRQLEQLGHSQAVLIEDLRLENDTLRTQIAGVISWQEHAPTMAANRMGQVGTILDEMLGVRPAKEIVREIMGER